MTTSPGTRQETAAPAPRTSRLFMPFYLLAFAGLMATTATPVAVTLALRAQQLYGEEKTAVLATTLAIGTVFASVAQPLGG